MGKEGPFPKPRECKPLRRWPRFRQPWRAWPSQNHLELVQPVTMESRLQDVAGRAIASALLPAPWSEHACFVGWIPTIITSVCVYIYIYECMYLSKYIYIYLSIYELHIFINIYIYTHIYIYAPVSISTYLSIYLSTFLCRQIGI